MLVVMTGLPGTGKSTLVRELLQTAPGICLDKDLIRPALFPPAAIDYTAAQDDVCVEAMLLAAEYLFDKDRTRLIFLDGRPFVRRRQREQVLDWAARLSVVPVLIECICPEELARERLERDRAQHLADNRDFALYQSLKAQWEPIAEPHLTVDTSQALEQCTAAVLDALRTGSYH
jgi:adenylylsulfate kinase